MGFERGGREVLCRKWYKALYQFQHATSRRSNKYSPILWPMYPAKLTLLLNCAFAASIKPSKDDNYLFSPAIFDLTQLLARELRFHSLPSTMSASLRPIPSWLSQQNSRDRDGSEGPRIYILWTPCASFSCSVLYNASRQPSMKWILGATEHVGGFPSATVATLSGFFDETSSRQWRAPKCSISRGLRSR